MIFWFFINVDVLPPIRNYVPGEYILYMKNLKKFHNFVNEWIDSPGSIDVPGDSYENRVRSRNYHSTDPTMPQVYDAMFEASYFHDFLDQEGKSENFNKFLSEGKKSGSDITNYIKESFKEKSIKKKD